MAERSSSDGAGCLSLDVTSISVYKESHCKVHRPAWQRGKKQFSHSAWVLSHPSLDKESSSCLHLEFWYILELILECVIQMFRARFVYILEKCCREKGKKISLCMYVYTGMRALFKHNPGSKRALKEPTLVTKILIICFKCLCSWKQMTALMCQTNSALHIFPSPI